MPGDLQYLTINDFAPGIRHKVFGGGQAAMGPLGAADPAATFRCVVLAGGGLGPLPKVDWQEVNGSETVVGTPTDGYVRVSGIHATGPIQADPSTSVLDGVDNIELHFVLEVHNSGGHEWYWYRYKLWEDPYDIDTISLRNISHPGTYDFVYTPTAFVDARMHEDDATQLGDVFVVVGWHPDDMDSTDNIWEIYPGPSSPSTNGTDVILNVNETTILVQHQGRVVSIDNHVFQHSSSGHWVVNDQLVWTQVNLPTVEEDPPGTIVGVGVFTQGPISGYGAACSASAQELLLVKHRGGATIISGDLDDPTVMSLPGVASTRGAVTYGVFTQLGFVYGVNNGGIHAWGGGDASEKLSMFMDDDFWQMRPDDWRNFDGKFDIIGDWILCPNNWVFDIPSRSWWRIEDPDTYQIFQWSSSPQSPKFYGVPAKYGVNDVLLNAYDVGNLSSDYQWQSQYIAQSIDRVMEIREINLRAISPNGESKVIVTLTNEAGETQSETFDVTATTMPKLLRLNTAFKGTGIKVKLEASSLDDEPAPTIYELNLGYQMAEQEAMS